MLFSKEYSSANSWCGAKYLRASTSEGEVTSLESFSYFSHDNGFYRFKLGWWLVEPSIYIFFEAEHAAGW